MPGNVYVAYDPPTREQRKKAGNILDARDTLLHMITELGLVAWGRNGELPTIDYMLGRAPDYPHPDARAELFSAMAFIVLTHCNASLTGFELGLAQAGGRKILIMFQRGNEAVDERRYLEMAGVGAMVVVPYNDPLSGDYFAQNRVRQFLNNPNDEPSLRPPSPFQRNSTG